MFLLAYIAAPPTIGFSANAAPVNAVAAKAPAAIIDIILRISCNSLRFSGPFRVWDKRSYGRYSEKVSGRSRKRFRRQKVLLPAAEGRGNMIGNAPQHTPISIR